MPKLGSSSKAGGTLQRTSSVDPLARRLTALEGLLGRVLPFDPQSALGAKYGANKGNSTYDGYTTHCNNYGELLAAWRKALYWTDPLDCTLSVMLAASATVMLVGEQLWVKIVGPPSSGKTTLIEGLATARSHVLSKDTIRGFYSGYKDGNSDEDNSIAALVKGRTLATKDGDTLLRAPNVAQILAEGRGLYDRVGRTHYRNKVENDYEGHRMTWLLCGTSALRELDDSELGARFLDCVIMDSIEDEFEDDVCMSALRAELGGMNVEADGKPESHYSAELAHAMMMTGGYLNYLRDNCVELINEVTVNESTMRACRDMGKFIAIMRARPSKKQDEDSDREFAARLVRQIGRLSRGLAVVINRQTVDDEVMRRVRKVTLDTSRGKVLRVVQRLYELGKGMQSQGLALHLDDETVKVNKLLRFLRANKVLRYEKLGRTWHLTDYVRGLYQRVVEGG